MKRRPIHAALAFALLLSGPSAQAQAPAAGEPPTGRSTKVVLMIVSTTRGVPKLSSTVVGIKEMVKRGVDAVNQGKPPGAAGYVHYDDFAVDITLDETIDVESLRKKVRSLGIDQDTTLIFYYIGHALWDSSAGPEALKNPRNHILELDFYAPNLTTDELHRRRRFRRSDLLKRLDCRDARTLVLITDCCASKSDEPVGNIPRFGAEPLLFDNLFLRPVGVYDLTSATYPENAWVDNTGPVFTNAFLSMLNDPNVAQDLDWPGFFGALVKRTGSDFTAYQAKHLKRAEALDIREGWVQALRDQKCQTPVLRINHDPVKP